MSSLQIFELQADLCRALSHPLRLQLVHHLHDGPKRVSELIQITGNHKGTVSRHLSVLRSSGILTTHHQGREIIYQIVDPKISELCMMMRQVLVEQASRSSNMLKTLED